MNRAGFTSLSPASFLGVFPFSAFASRTRAAPASPAAQERFDTQRLLDAVRKAPDLSLLEWDGDANAAPLPVVEDARELEGRRRRIRDRYVSARFPGVARNAADLADAPRVIKAARLYFEEEDITSALELLKLAVEEAPQADPVWLARLEILFLARDAAAFTACARDFRAAHPRHAQWAEVLRLGRALCPEEPLFREGGGVRAHEHYGPWPDLPNWIQAPWDLTGEILAADFHRAMDRLQTVRGLVPPLAA